MIQEANALIFDEDGENLVMFKENGVDVLPHGVVKHLHDPEAEVLGFIKEQTGLRLDFKALNLEITPTLADCYSHALDPSQDLAENAFWSPVDDVIKALYKLETKGDHQMAYTIGLVQRLNF